MSLRKCYSSARIGLLLFCGCCSFAAVLTGCGKSDAPAISANNSPYKVADGESTGGTPASTGNANGGAQATVSDGEPGKPPAIGLQPESYTIPDGEQELRDFLLVMQNRKPVGENRLQLIQDYQNIQRARIDAAERLNGLASTDDVRKLAIQAKLDALRAFSLTGSPEATNAQRELLAYSRGLLKEKNEEIAFLGRLTVFGLAVDDLRNGNVDDVQPLTDELKAMIATRPDDAGLYRVAGSAAVLLQQTGHRDEAMEAYTLIGNTYSKHADEEIAADAVSYLDRAKILELDLEGKIQALMRGQANATAPVLETVGTLLQAEKLNEQMLGLTLQIAQILEMTRHFAEAGKVLEMTEAAFKDNPDPDLVDQMTSSVATGRKRLSLIGKPLSVAGVLVDGSPFDWSAYKGKVVLIDFWATWCGPCLAELPNIVRNYEAYHEKGLEVVGVNLDDNLDDVKEFLSVQPLPWKTVISADPEQRGFENPLVDVCGIESIPFIVMLDREGKVSELHVRGDRLGEKLAELLGPADDAPAKPRGDKPATENPSESSAAEPDQFEDSQSAALSNDSEFVFCALCEEPAAEEATPNAEINPYAAGPDLSTAELLEFIFTMQDKPKSIQGRPGFAEAVIEAADRILAAEASAKQRQIAAQTKFQILHGKACLGDDKADQQLMEFVRALQDSPDEKIAADVRFFQLERKAIDADAVPLENLSALLDELQQFFTKTELEARHLRIASSTVHAINRLEDGDAREKHFEKFGELFAKSTDKELARYGKKIAKKTPAGPAELIGKPLELAGVTSEGNAFDWKAYRGKVVLVDFWATWCGPCIREMPHVKELHSKLHERGFEIVGVSLDRDLEALAKYLEENAIPWTNLAGEENNQLAQKYGVRGIPTMMLVDREGAIVAISHKVDELTEKIEGLLGPAK